VLPCPQVGGHIPRSPLKLGPYVVVVYGSLTLTSNTTPAHYDTTALRMIKPRKHQRLADPLLQSGVVTCSDRV